MTTLTTRLLDNNKIELTLEYSGEQVIDVYKNSLPWGNRYSLILVAVKADAIGTLVPQQQVINDPSPSTIAIQPGDRLTGEINLNERLVGLDEALKTSDVIVFWNYEMRTIESVVAPRIGGWLLISRCCKEKELIDGPIS